MSDKSNGGWGQFREVFRVVLHDIKGSSASSSYSRAMALMGEMESTLPSTYIHIPDNLCISINGRAVRFNYYQSRLVELTEFRRRIDPCRPVGVTKDWREENSGYNYKFVIGFDATRVDEKQQQPRLMFHSRHSGRLVKSEEDCRKYLKLPMGSTEFCHGLTVIVDDVHGHLPLNPTKEDIAFGEDEDIAFGEEGADPVHETNLKAWISAYAHLFYKIHKDLKFGGSKAALGAGISRISSQLKCTDWDGPSRLDNCRFTQYVKQDDNDKGIVWKYFKEAKTIRCGNVKSVSESIEVGRDTRWRFDDYPEVQNDNNTAPRSKKRRIEPIRGTSNAAISAEMSTTRAEPPGPDYKKLYEELKKEHESLKEEHRDLDKRKGDYKKEVKRLKKVLEIERDELKEKEEELKEKDEKIEKSERKYRRLKEQIRSIGICTTQVSL